MKVTTAIFVLCCLLVNTVQAQSRSRLDAELCLTGTGNELLDIEICGRAIRVSAAAGLHGASLATLYSTRGRAYTARSEFQSAISDLDVALRLNPASAIAYNYRGAAHHAQGRYRLALEDYERAIELFPHYAEAFRNRGTSHYFRGDAEHAAADYSRAIALNSADPEPVALRGLARYERGLFAKAAQDFARLESMRFPYKYLAMWLYLAWEQAHGDARALLSEAESQLATSEWPRPLIAVYLGNGTPQAALAAARAAPTATRAARLSEAHFYLGELALLQGDRQRAAVLFRDTVAAGITQSIEHHMAGSALQRMAR